MEQAPQRLKRRREFLQAARAGRKWAAPGLVLQVLEREAALKANARDPVAANNIRVGFTVTKKVGGAVIRNRAKRRLRAAVEMIMPTHAALGRDYVVIGRARTNARPFPALVDDLETAMRKLNAWHGIQTCTGNTENDKEQRNG